MIDRIPEWAQAVGVVGSAVTVLLALWVKIRPKVKETKRDLRDFRDAVLGRDAIMHPDTGKEIVPAAPGIGQRMATQEAATSDIQTAIVTLTHTVGQLASVRSELDSHEQRITTLEQKQVESALARTESIELLRTVETAIKSTPKED